MLEDPKLREQVVALITNRLFTPEYAVNQISGATASRSRKPADSYLLQRARDFEDIEQRLLRNLLGRRRDDLSRLATPVVIVARDLAPSQTAGLDRDKVLAIATEAGGRTSHTAILARALGIPAVVGVQGLGGQVAGGDMMVVDGAHGVVILNPDALTRRRYEALGHSREAIEERIAAEYCNLPAVTTRRPPHRHRGQHRIPAGGARHLPARRGRRRPLPHRVPLPHRRRTRRTKRRISRRTWRRSTRSRAAR